MTQAVRILAVNDWGFRLHASYGETIERFLAIFDTLAAEGMFPNGTRWFFDHAETASRRSIDRIAALGGAISVQNRTMFQAQPFTDRYGPAAAQTAPPIRAMLDAGLTVSSRIGRYPRSELQPLAVAVLAGHRHGHQRAAPAYRTQPR